MKGGGTEPFETLPTMAVLYVLLNGGNSYRILRKDKSQKYDLRNSI